MTDPLVAFVLLMVSPSGQIIREPRATIPMSECVRDSIGFQLERHNHIMEGKVAAIGLNEILAVLCEPCPCGGPTS